MISLPAQLARTRRFTYGVPEQFTVARDGAAVLFLRSRAGDDPVPCLWELDLDTHAERLLAEGVDAYATDRAADLVAFARDSRLWTVDVASGRARCLPAEGPVVDPRPDPAGGRIAYRSGGALRVTNVDGVGDRLVVAPDGPEVTFGVAPLGGPRGYW